MPPDLPARRALVCVSGLIYWAGVLVQARRVRRHIGRQPNVRPRSTREKLLWAGWLIVVAVWLGQPFFAGKDSSFPATCFAPWAINAWTLVAGAMLLAAGYAGTLWCYASMGDSWRMGVNAAEKNPLVTLGPYRSVRHPIYLFQIVMLAATVLLLPTALSVLVLAFHIVCVSIKVADEERYLLATHGQNYGDYLARTGRWLPGGLRKGAWRRSGT